MRSTMPPRSDQQRPSVEQLLRRLRPRWGARAQLRETTWSLEGVARHFSLSGQADSGRRFQTVLWRRSWRGGLHFAGPEQGPGIQEALLECSSGGASGARGQFSLPEEDRQARSPAAEDVATARPRRGIRPCRIRRHVTGELREGPSPDPRSSSTHLVDS